MSRICAALSYFDEPVEFLDRCVRSLAGVADEVLALDGAWRLFPGGQPMSPPEQEEAVWAAARAIGVPVRVKVPSEVYASQVAKRAHLMELAADHCDWVLVIDADEYVARADGEETHRLLEKRDADCGAVGWRNLNRGETHMPGAHAMSGLNRRLFRAGTTVRVVHSGYFYQGRNVLIEDNHVDLRETLLMEHDNINRGAERNERARAYRRDRQRLGVETWVTV